MGPYQQTPKEVAIELLDTQVFWVRSLGPSWRFLGCFGSNVIWNMKIQLSNKEKTYGIWTTWWFGRSVDFFLSRSKEDEYEDLEKWVLPKTCSFFEEFYLLNFTGVCCIILRHLPSDVGRSRWNDCNPSKSGSVTPINQTHFPAICCGGRKARYIKPHVKWPKPWLIAAYPQLISLWGDTRRAPLCLPKLVNLYFRSGKLSFVWVA